MIKTRQWPLKPKSVSSKWNWFYNDATAVVPFWEARGGDNISPINLVNGNALTIVGTPVWGAGVQGIYSKAETTSEYFELGPENEIIPRTTHGSYLIVKRKTDGTNRASSLFGYSTERVHAHVPFSDGTVYFDFGGFGSEERISIGGLNFSGIQVWAFTAGPSGMNMYLDGKHLVGNSFAASRFAGTETFLVGAGNTVASDLQELYFFASFDAELTAEQVVQWSKDPYGAITKKSNVIYFVAPAAGGWAHTVNTVTSPDIVNTVANGDIGEINGVAA